MLIDTHTHLNFSAFNNDREEVIEKCLKNDIWVINVGTQYDTSKKAVEIAEKYNSQVYATIGLHPLHLETRKLGKSELGELPKFKTRTEIFDKAKYSELAKSKKVVAIGEIGLDYYYKPKGKQKLAVFKDRQIKALLTQINLAEELNLPIIFHCRMAHKDLIAILKSIINQKRKIRGVIHSFVGANNELQEYLKMGFYIGFNGIIFKEIAGINFKENILNTPLDKILLETDSPYLTPPNFYEQRNNSLAVKIVAEYIAKIRGLSFTEISQITTDNAKRLFIK